MKKRKTCPTACLMLSAISTPALAQVFTSEFFADPVTEAWTLLQSYCEPETWNADGWYHQALSLKPCPPGPVGGREVYRRSLDAFSGAAEFFVEFRVETDGDQSEIPFGAPALVAFSSSFGVLYHITVAGDLVKFYRDAGLPILFIEIEPSVPHAYRVELRPGRYAFYIDGDLIDEGVPEGPFPGNDPRITWQGQSWYLPCHNAWDYIRYGAPPGRASGDYDSDDTVGLFDYYFVHDCLTKDGPGIFAGPEQYSGPGCDFTDFDRDADADLLDFAEFANQFTGSQP